MRHGEVFSDKDLVLEWKFFGVDLRVTHRNVVVYNSLTGFKHPGLSDRQVQWIGEHYEKNKKNYVFLSEEPSVEPQ